MGEEKDFEKLKIWIDLGKWAIASVAMVIITQIIDAGFKDREVGLNEIQEYNKYVTLVTDYNKIAERRLLAQYFAYVTPSDKLREGWMDYYKIIDEEYMALLKEREMKAEELKNLISTETSVIQNESIRQIQNDLEKIDMELTPTFAATGKTMDIDAAKTWEEIGFKSLLEKDLDNAILAFGNSEKAYNSFHQVYEIQRFLLSRKNSGEKRDDTFWKGIYKKIITEYSWKMPEDIKKDLEKSLQ
jgi:hypothetical protein